jgi:crotonobetainyl-CoA:carnitine CoA-transferase CaiB-like acyl-CoA transferase
MNAIGRDDFAKDPAMSDNAGRVIHQEKIDTAIADWCATHTIQSAIEQLEAVRVPAGPIYNAQDMAEDPHFQARDLFEKVEVNGDTLTIPGMAPKLVGTPGSTQWPGPTLGQHTDEVLSQLLAFNEERITALKEDAVI